MYETVFRKYVPGFEQARVIDIGARVGVRETRLIRGDARLTEADVRECRKPGDRIACSAWPLETHGRGPVTNWEFLPDGEYYGIPWGCLVVAGLDNLLVAGRNLSASMPRRRPRAWPGPAWRWARPQASARRCVGRRAAAPATQTGDRLFFLPGRKKSLSPV
jgi:hypothetical protein